MEETAEKEEEHKKRNHVFEYSFDHILIVIMIMT